MNRPDEYKNKDTWRKAKNRQRKRNYNKTGSLYKNTPKRLWIDEEISMLFNNTITDTELSAILMRSVQSIQVKRCKIKADMLKKEKAS